MTSSFDMIQCSCGHVYYNQTNYYGKVCGKCFAIIPPKKPIDVIEHNRMTDAFCKQAVLNKIKELVHRSGPM